MATLKLTCFVIDRSCKPIGLPPFEITIARTARVYDLLEPIRTQCGPQVVDSHIWKLKSILPADVPDRLSRFTEGLHPDVNCENDSATWLTPSSSLERHFPAPLPSGCVHILAQPIQSASGGDAVEESSVITGHKGRLAAVSDGRKALSPSVVLKSLHSYREEQRLRPIYNGWPCHLTGPSVGLYSKAFAQLIDALRDLSAVVPTPDKFAATGDFMWDVSSFYPRELRQELVFKHLIALLGDPILPQIKLDEEGNGISLATLRTGEQAVLAYYEVKSNPRIGDAGLHAALTYRRHIVQSEYDYVRNASCCPCFIVSISGPYICFFGAVFPHAPIVQHLTDFIYLGGHPFTRDRILHVARIFHVVSKAIEIQFREYTEKQGNRIEDPSCVFPYSSFGVTDNEGRSLVYCERLDDRSSSTRAMWRGRLGDTDVIVKFCDTYCGDAHRLLSDAGLAPRLHHFDRVEGGLYMAVMDFVSGKDADDYLWAFRHAELSDGVRADITRAINILHEAGFVFGDLRRPNILVVEGELDTDGNRVTRGMLVDFDWAGLCGQATYPQLLNDDLVWACGVQAGGLVEKEHDLFMLQMLEPF